MTIGFVDGPTPVTATVPYFKALSQSLRRAARVNAAAAVILIVILVLGMHTPFFDGPIGLALVAAYGLLLFAQGAAWSRSRAKSHEYAVRAWELETSALIEGLQQSGLFDPLEAFHAMFDGPTPPDVPEKNWREMQASMEAEVRRRMEREKGED